MKKTILISILPALALFFFIAAQVPTAPENPDLDWPEEITTLLDKACYDCHSSDAKNVKAKSAINFSKWNDLKLSKKQKKMNAIMDVVKMKDMPPNKYLKNYPENALSDDEINTIVSWAEEQMKQMQE
jgi:hypothetical protein